MTNNAQKKAARLRQAKTGVPYTQALRDVDNSANQAKTGVPYGRALHNANLLAHLGIDPDGAAVTLDLNEPSHGGVGPHCFITGRTGFGKSALVERIARSLASDVHNAEPEMYVHCRLRGSLPSAVTKLDTASLAPALKQLMDDRREGGSHAPAVVLIDHCDGWLSQPSGTVWSRVETLRRLVREGRSLGVHLVLALQHEYPLGALGPAGSAVADNIPTGIRLNSPSFGDLRLGEGLLQHSTNFDIHRYCKTSALDVRFRFEAP